ncbi:unnamed protein product [Ambrosiozyma monospora]|uniref:Unnamed protein product n=1 Tax=Ambrosiozyma monospora TaxID=43982 RepID=A0ACB5U042_AMBMO|nr:unnamed protein product [Ambrosiozyma monospora]
MIPNQNYQNRRGIRPRKQQLRDRLGTVPTHWTPQHRIYMAFPSFSSLTLNKKTSYKSQLLQVTNNIALH